jgi:hypothetical protein
MFVLMYARGWRRANPQNRPDQNESETGATWLFIVDPVRQTGHSDGFRLSSLRCLQFVADRSDWSHPNKQRGRCHGPRRRVGLFSKQCKNSSASNWRSLNAPEKVWSSTSLRRNRSSPKDEAEFCPSHLIRERSKAASSRWKPRPQPFQKVFFQR